MTELQVVKKLKKHYFDKKVNGNLKLYKKVSELKRLTFSSFTESETELKSKTQIECGISHSIGNKFNLKKEFKKI